MKNSSIDAVLGEISQKPALVNFVVPGMTFILTKILEDITNTEDQRLVKKLIDSLDTWEK
ncbi:MULTISPECIES: hypothetical protein [Streptomyces]|uniref:Uncharacterized protein n=1 Tax=Streptomyces viridochromogenes TaxID=1938 RepID=A0A0L8KEV2_STRVR|nr:MULTISPECIES: hypothetical protein [Streptomyces]KOG24458.1 hypothetical protein ADK34_18770 [Streptomyces viridochromogenes]